MNEHFNLRLGNDIYTYKEAIKRFGKHHVDNWYKYPEMLAGAKPRQTSSISKNSDVKPESGKKITQPLPSKPGMSDRAMFDKSTVANPKVANLNDAGQHKSHQSNAHTTKGIEDWADLCQIKTPGLYVANKGKMPVTSIKGQVITEYYRREFTYNDFVQWHTANFHNGDDIDRIFNAFSRGTLGKDDHIVLHGTVTMDFAKHRAYYHMYNESGLPMSYNQNITTNKCYNFQYNIFPTNGEMHHGQQVYRLITDNESYPNSQTYKLVADNGLDHLISPKERKESRDKIKKAFQSITEPTKPIKEPNSSSTGDKILRNLAEDKSLDMFTINDSEGHSTTYVKNKDQSDDTTSTYQPDVTHPNYYSEGGKDVIDCLPDLVGNEGTIGFLQGNVIKYTVRFQRKNGVEDLHKAKVYLDRLEKVYKEVKYGNGHSDKEPK